MEPLFQAPDAEKTCTKCGGPGPFAKNKSAPDGLQRWCKKCQKIDSAARYERDKTKIDARCSAYRAAHPGQYKEYDAKTKASNPALYMWLKARSRAERAGIPFTITAEDIVIPEHCPLLGVPLQRGTGSVCRNSPTLDRKIPALGYVKDNVWVISHKANAIKQDATMEELELLVYNLRREFGTIRGN